MSDQMSVDVEAARAFQRVFSFLHSFIKIENKTENSHILKEKDICYLCHKEKTRHCIHYGVRCLVTTLLASGVMGL